MFDFKCNIQSKALTYRDIIHGENILIKAFIQSFTPKKTDPKKTKKSKKLNCESSAVTLKERGLHCQRPQVM